MPSRAHNDQYISLYKYIRWGFPLISHSETFHRALTMINIYHLNKYNKSRSDSGIVPHQTAVQEHFSWISLLAEVLTLSTASPTPLQPSSLATVIGGSHSSNIQELQTNSFGGGPTRAEETLMSSFAASVRWNQFGTTRKQILQKGGIRFYRKRRELSNNSGILHLSDKVSSTLRTQKNAVKNVTVTQWRTTTTLCPVHIWAEIIIRLDWYSGTTSDTSLNTVWVERHKTTITSQTTTN